MTKEEEVIEYFKSHRKIFCEDHLKICPKDSIAYQATLKEKEFYDMAIKALEQQSNEDCVSREDVISVLNSHWLNGSCARRIIDEQIDEVKKLSSITPTRKKGKWIERELVQCHIRGDRKILVCSNCNLGIANGILGFANFCPTCGADMRGNKE